jgi:hypothetical protein
MKMRAAMGAALLALSLPSLAVNRCTIDGKTVYQDPPCPGTMGTVGDEIKAMEARRQIEKEQEERRAAGQKRRDAMQAEFKAVTGQMADYAVAIGRGIACDAPGTESAYRRFVAWMDAKGLSTDYRNLATATIREATKRQREGITPDSCVEVRYQFSKYPWP